MFRWGQDRCNQAMLGQALSELNLLRKKVYEMSQQLTDLQTAVTNLTATVATAVTLIQSQENPAQLVPLTAAVNAANTTLSAAVTAATPTPTA